MCRNARMRASNTEKLNPDAKPFRPFEEAKASDLNTFKLPHHFYQHQPRLLLPPPPPTAAAVPVIFSSPPFIRYHPIYYYNQVCNYNVQLQTNTSSKKAQSERISGYPSEGFIGGGVVAAGGGRRAAVTKRAVAKREPRHSFGFNKEKIYAKCWRPKRFSEPHSSSTPAAASPTVPSEDVSACGKTTIMIKNIPNQFRRNNLLDFLDRQCEENSDQILMEYDFVYLPMDFRTGDNLGYAFVNLTSTEGAVMMRAILYQYKWGLCNTTSGLLFESKKICEITWAKIQGKENLTNHFKNSKFPCRNSEYLPVYFSQPRNGSASLTVPTTIGNCLASAPIEDGEN